MLEFPDRPIAYHRCFVSLTGSVMAAVMLSHALPCSQGDTDSDGWFHKTREEWEADTGLTRYEQETAREKLRACHFWEEERRGIPAKLFFRVKLEVLQESVSLNPGHSPQIDWQQPRVDVEYDPTYIRAHQGGSNG